MCATCRLVLAIEFFFTAIVTIAGALAGVSGASGEIFKKEDLLRGVTMSRVQCDATPQALWLNVDGHDFCVRYYRSTAGGEGARPVIVLQGDELGKDQPEKLDLARYLRGQGHG